MGLLVTFPTHREINPTHREINPFKLDFQFKGTICDCSMAPPVEKRTGFVYIVIFYLFIICLFDTRTDNMTAEDEFCMTFEAVEGLLTLVLFVKHWDFEFHKAYFPSLQVKLLKNIQYVNTALTQSSDGQINSRLKH